MPSYFILTGFNRIEWKHMWLWQQVGQSWQQMIMKNRSCPLFAVPSSSLKNYREHWFSHTHLPHFTSLARLSPLERFRFVRHLVVLVMRLLLVFWNLSAIHKSTTGCSLKILFFSQNFVIFLNSASSPAALMFYLPAVYTHTDAEGKARVWNI